MNPRIKELIKAAGGIAYDDDGNELTVMLVGKNLEKFAELLIRECATLKLDPMQIDGAQYYHGWLDYRDEIWKHFGVNK